MTTSFLAYLETEDTSIELVTCDDCGVVLTYFSANKHDCPQKEEA